MIQNVHRQLVITPFPGAGNTRVAALLAFKYASMLCGSCPTSQCLKLSPCWRVREAAEHLDRIIVVVVCRRRRRSSTNDNDHGYSARLPRIGPVSANLFFKHDYIENLRLKCTSIHSHNRPPPPHPPTPLSFFHTHSHLWQVTLICLSCWTISATTTPNHTT